MFRTANVIPQLLQGRTLTVEGVIIANGPDGETVVLSARDPEKRLYDPIVIFEVADFPGRIVTGF